MHLQKDDPCRIKTDSIGQYADIAHEIVAQLWRTPLRATHGSLARPRLALHLQQDYLMRIEGNNAFTVSSLKRITAMAAYQTSPAAPMGAVSIFRTVRVFGNAFEAISAWNNARITRNSLSKLSDRELDDIGLCRGDIEMIGR